MLFLKHNIWNDFDDLTDVARMYKAKAVPNFIFLTGGAMVHSHSLLSALRDVLMLCTHALHSCSILMLCTHALYACAVATVCAHLLQSSSIISLCLTLYFLSFTIVDPFFAFPLMLHHAVRCERTLVTSGL